MSCLLFSLVGRLGVYRLLFAVLLPVLPFQKADLAFQSQALAAQKAALKNEVKALWRGGKNGYFARYLYAFSAFGKTLQPFSRLSVVADIHRKSD